MRWFTLLIPTTAFLLAVVACGGGDGDKASKAQGSALGPNLVSINVGGGGSSDVTQAIVTGPDTSIDNSDLQEVSSGGIRVSGYGDASAKPTGATVRLTIGGGTVFSGSSSDGSPALSFIKPVDLQPVVDAI